MGGYAFYIWGSYLIAFMAIGGEVLLLWRRRHAQKQANYSLPESEHDEKTS
jgi:heme exporter protein CcmD